MELQAEGPGKTSYTVSKFEFLVSPVSARSCNTTSLFRILNPNPPLPPNLDLLPKITLDLSALHHRRSLPRRSGRSRWSGC